MDRNVHRNIKRAEDNGISIKINQNYEDFYKMYLDHINAKKHIKWYNICNIEIIKKSGTLFTAEQNGKILSGAVFLEDEDHIVYWISSSYRYSEDGETRKLVGNASYAIQWEVIKYAKEKGIKEYNLGPCMTDDIKVESLIQFKKGVGGKIITHYNYYKDYNRFLRMYQALRRRINNSRLNTHQIR